MDEVFASVMVVVLQIAPLEGLFKQMLLTAQHASVYLGGIKMAGGGGGRTGPGWGV